MTTYAQLAAQMLRQSADMFRSFGESSPEVREQMDTFAVAYAHVADQLEVDPTGPVPRARPD